MFYLLKSNKAFNRTSPHPADPAVRIAHHEDDLAALHYRNKARAVIFKRALPAAVIDELKNYKVPPHDMRGLYGPAVKITPFKNTFNQCVNSPQRLKESPAIMADMAYVANVFYKAAGRIRFSKPEGLNMAEWFMDIDAPETRSKEYHLLLPHIDGPLMDPRRMTCAYTEDPEGMGTGWFPGTFNRRDDISEIAKEFLTADNPQAVLEKYNHQTTDAGDLVFFHTEFPDSVTYTDNRKLSLLHNSPKPPTNKPRLLLLLPT